MSAQLQLKSPCLGRPFKLGMLYDCHTETLIPGKTLWDSKVLNSALQRSANSSSSFEIITDDTIKKKSYGLDLDGDLKLSFLSGMVEVGGAARFMNDQQSSKSQSRVTLKYSCTTRFEQLTMEQLGSIQYPHVLDDHHATHVVSGVTYGSDAFFVFDRTVSIGENLMDIQGKMEAQIKRMIPISGSASLDIKTFDKTETEKFHCKFYGDVILPSNPSTFDEAVKVYKELPQYLKLNCDTGDRSVPKVVYLSPLSELNIEKPKQIIRSLNHDLISQVEKIMESFHNVEVLCNDHKNHDICSKFSDIKSQLSNFLTLVNRFKMKFVRELSLLLPEIRSSRADESKLAELIASTLNSPFDDQKIEKYLRGKGREIKSLAQYVKNMNKESQIQFLFPSANCELETLVANDEIEYVVCFAFNSTSDTSPYIKYLDNYLKTGIAESVDYKEWFDRTEVSKKMRSTVKSFTEFARTNSNSTTAAFAVTDRNEDIEEASGPAIILYNNGVPANFEPPGKPGTPTVTKTTHDSVDLNWTMPVSDSDTIKAYKLLYNPCKASEGSLSKSTSKMSIHVEGLSPDTDYNFSVQAVSEPGVSVESNSCTVTTNPSVRQADVLKNISDLLEAGNPATYQLPLTLIHGNPSNDIYAYGLNSSNDCKPEKVLMVLGATGAGKSTLINGMANYILGVDWKDDFRFKLIPDEGSRSQAHSQTRSITSYTIHCDCLPYNLTIIDTPGFGDTGGFNRDKKIVKQIKNFFSGPDKSKINQLHGIGFVTQASFSRLTSTQKYIFNSILSIFGKDIGGNIFLMCTFADAKTPTVLEAAKVAKLPIQGSYKFNNSALFASNEISDNDSAFDSMFWNMGNISFKFFFDQFEKAEPRGLELTREVLEEREQLETLIPALQEQIRVGLSQLDIIQQDKKALEQHEADISANKNFTYERDEIVMEKIPLPDTVTTTCLKCNFTCHKLCAYSNDSEKRHCSSMDSDGNCKACPIKCHWDIHANLPFHIKYTTIRVIRTSDDLKSRYETALTGKQQAEYMISMSKQVLSEVQQHVYSRIDEARRSIMKLGEIALKPNPLTEVDYLDILIETERSEGNLGWLNRVAQYKEMRKNAEFLSMITKSDGSLYKMQVRLFSLTEDSFSDPKKMIESLNEIAASEPHQLTELEYLDRLIATSDKTVPGWQVREVKYKKMRKDITEKKEKGIVDENKSWWQALLGSSKHHNFII